MARHQLLDQFLDRNDKCRSRLVVKFTGFIDPANVFGSALVQPDSESRLEFVHPVYWEMINQSSLNSEKQCCLTSQRQGIILRLREDCTDSAPVLDNSLVTFVDHSSETGENLQLQELRIIEPDRRGGLAQGWRLRAGDRSIGPGIPRSGSAQ